MAFSDFPMPEDYPSYAAHHQVARLLRGVRRALRLPPHDHLRHLGRARSTRNADGSWQVRIAGPDGEETREYAAVLVANGHHWDARWPEPAYPGDFEGEQIHAHDYRSSAELAGRDVVVVGMGNSALDISVEAAKVARSATISVRRGQWVMPKYLLGRAADQTALPGWTPWWVTRARMELGATRHGQPDQAGHPAPRPPAGAEPPGAVGRVHEAGQGRGRSPPKPGIDHLEGRSVVFTDGTSAPADLIVWATGYRVTFPFLDPALIAAKDNDLPLWKRMVHPDLPGLYFIGLVQAVGAVMPISEAQGAWVAQMLTGQYLPPPDQEIRALMQRDHQQNKRRFYPSARHTMEVDFDHFLWDLDRERKRGAERAAGDRMSGALVTGAGRGLGREIALRLARRGHVVHVTDVDEVLAAEARPRDRRRDRGGRLRLRARRPRRRGLPHRRRR